MTVLMMMMMMMMIKKYEYIIFVPTSLFEFKL
jgi:hypothetical protein